MKNYETIYVKIADLTANYSDTEEGGVRGYDNKLNIRPAYQREFVYKDKQRDAVIDTIFDDMFLGIMWWAKNEDGTFEVLDGQQRTISICQYINGAFSYEGKYFHNLTDDVQEKILAYEVEIKVFDGTQSEKLAWFERINVAGEKLTPQELRNAVYTGAWLEDAKRYFSKRGCVAMKLCDKYIKADTIRQELLEKVLTWISNGNVEEYMGRHQHDKDANELKQYFQKVMNWVKMIFPKTYKEMLTLDWGRLYNEYYSNEYNTNDVADEISRLMADEDVTSKKGIFEYILSRGEKEKVLNIRAFDEKAKREAYESQGGICPLCGKYHEYEDMEGDHITPWSKGGHTDKDNLQMICKTCNRTKSAK